MSCQNSKLTKEEVFDRVKFEIESLYQYGLENGLTNDVVDDIVRKSFEEEAVEGQSQEQKKEIKKWNKSMIWNLLFIVSCCILFLVVVFLVMVIAISHKPTQKFVTRHGQGYVYPIMRYLRLLTLPYLLENQHLTKLHDEECLLQNPFYQLPPIDCWSCEDVRAVIDLTSLSNLTTAYHDSGVPFITQDVLKRNSESQRSITFSVLRRTYHLNKDILDHGTLNVRSSDGSLENLDQLFVQDEIPLNLHVEWKVKRVPAVQVIRKLFPRPYFVPSNVEVSLQRFLFIDGANFSSYSLPFTEFANIWIAQGSGYRQVGLIPSTACAKRCHAVSILLKPGDIMFYNWQFYTAKTSAAKIDNSTIVTFLGSFY